MDQYFEFTTEGKSILEEQRNFEEKKLSPYATKNKYSLRIQTRKNEDLLRSNFGIDVDRILHNLFYNRYTDKTQVFSFYKNDDIARRGLHVQLVSRIARIIGHALKLNLDLIEAIALGHDIGHTPFGHKGEQYLSDLYYTHAGRYFNHNVHGVRVLKTLTNSNLNIQTYDGILCHNGEKPEGEYSPNDKLDFQELEKLITNCYTNKETVDYLKPFTLEGCVVRVSDMIAYVGKDRQDADKAGLEIPEIKNPKLSLLKATNTRIITDMVKNIVKNSINKNFIKIDENVYEEFMRIKKHNSDHIYKNEKVNHIYGVAIKPMMEKLYNTLLEDINQNNKNSYIFTHHLKKLETQRLYKYDDYDNLELRANDIVVDYIASMTDDYFVELYKNLWPDDELNEHIKYNSYFD